MSKIGRTIAIGTAGCLAIAACSSSSDETATNATLSTEAPSMLVDTNDQPVRFEFDGPTYESADALFEGADLVIQGVRGEVVARLADFGRPGDDTSEFGIPWEFYEVEVTRVLAGDYEKETVLVSMLDPALAVSEATVATENGERLVLFLQKETAQTAPGMTRLGSDYYFPLNGSNGVFRVAGGDAVATSPIVRSVGLPENSPIEVDRDGQERDQDSTELLRVDLGSLQELAELATG